MLLFSFNFFFIDLLNHFYCNNFIVANFFLVNTIMPSMRNLDKIGSCYCNDKHIWIIYLKWNHPEEKCLQAHFLVHVQLKYLWTICFSFFGTYLSQWAKTRKKIQFQMCVWVVAQLPQRLKSTFLKFFLWRLSTRKNFKRRWF